MHSFENTQKETIQKETAYDILNYLNDHVLYPLPELSQYEIMATPVQLDITIGDWIACLSEWRIK